MIKRTVKYTSLSEVQGKNTFSKIIGAPWKQETVRLEVDT